MAEINLTGTHQGFGHTYRKDGWWVRPLIVFVCLTSFVIYTTWAAFQGEYYSFGPYLSPCTHRKYLVIPRIAGLVRNPDGGHQHYPFLLHSWSCGRPVYSGSPVTITVEPIIKLSGPIRLHAPSPNQEKNISEKILFR